MPALKADLVRRIERLPKPTRTSEALIPLFEAISNSIHSVQKKYKTNVTSLGTVQVTIEKARGKKPLTIIVSDNGSGLDHENFEAFSTTDTDNKIEIGGKGVGRLLWLDCFSRISVDSTYESGSHMRNRSFDFVLSNDEQIIDYEEKRVADTSNSYCTVVFKGLRNNSYSEKFPTRLGHIFRHITSHFLPTFIGKSCPIISITCDDETKLYPNEIDNYIFRRHDIDISPDYFGQMRITLMECDKIASSDLQGKHFVHFIAHDRTVKSQSIDGKLGLKFFGPDNNRVFHACIFGKYLDRNVNQERTKFIFEDSMIERIINEVCMPQIEAFLHDPLNKLKSEQAGMLQLIVDTYPSLSFGTIPELQKYVPLGETNEDAIFGHLSRQRYRRDQKQADKIRGVLERLKAGKIEADSFSSAIKDASEAMEDTERKSLAEYIVRRKVVLDFLEILVDKVKIDTKDSSYQREDVLHSFICPMQINGLSDDATKIVPSTHDLWIIDERLTLAEYFSSDVSFDEIDKKYKSTERPDLMIFDHVHGLRQSEDSSKVLLVEFKRPGRSQYRDDENPHLQIQRYVKRLLTCQERDVRGRRIKISSDTIFYCFIIADCVGHLAEWTASWAPTTDGRGRIYQPQAGFRGSIELIEWDALLKDARERNKAFFDRAGIPGTSIFSGK